MPEAAVAAAWGPTNIQARVHGLHDPSLKKLLESLGIQLWSSLTVLNTTLGSAALPWDQGLVRALLELSTLGSEPWQDGVLKCYALTLAAPRELQEAHIDFLEQVSGCLCDCVGRGWRIDSHSTCYCTLLHLSVLFSNHPGHSSIIQNHTPFRPMCRASIGTHGTHIKHTIK